MGLVWETLLVPEMLGQVQGSPVPTHAWCPEVSLSPRHGAGGGDNGGQDAWHLDPFPAVRREGALGHWDLR